MFPCSGTVPRVCDYTGYTELLLLTHPQLCESLYLSSVQQNVHPGSSVTPVKVRDGVIVSLGWEVSVRRRVLDTRRRFLQRSTVRTVPLTRVSYGWGTLPGVVRLFRPSPTVKENNIFKDVLTETRSFGFYKRLGMRYSTESLRPGFQFWGRSLESGVPPRTLCTLPRSVRFVVFGSVVPWV